MKRDVFRLLMFAAISVSLLVFSAACSQTTVQSTAPEDTVSVAPAEGTQPAAPEEGTGIESSEMGAGMGATESLESQPMEEAAPVFDEGRTSPGMLPLYFDFDQSLIREDQIQRLEVNATFLMDNPGVSVTIGGNCDERGTNEYNLALGERRAMSAQKYLADRGISADRMNTISYGEEKPINYGHDEMSWSQNRRDDFLISR